MPSPGSRSWAKPRRERCCCSTNAANAAASGWYRARRRTRPSRCLRRPTISPGALGPYGEVREGSGGVADAIGQLIDQQVSVLVLADVGTLDRDNHAKVTGFVEKGGLLLRFAGTPARGRNDDLVPVRSAGAAAISAARSPGRAPDARALLSREPLLRARDPARSRRPPPDPGRAGRRGAAQDLGALEDGTPIVTADRRGEGLIVLVHVTADAAWSNLPLTGLFLDMLRRTVALAGTTSAAASDPAPRRRPSRPPACSTGSARSSLRRRRPARSRSYRSGEPGAPPGLLRPGRFKPSRLNALVPGDRLAPLDLGRSPPRTAPLRLAETVDVRGPLLLAPFSWSWPTRWPPSGSAATCALPGRIGRACGRGGAGRRDRVPSAAAPLEHAFAQAPPPLGSGRRARHPPRLCDHTGDCRRWTASARRD
jgi:hypothetical protein